MRSALVAALVCAGLLTAVLTAVAPPSPATAQQTALLSSGAELVTLLLPPGDKQQGIVVIDPRLRVLSVYHIDRASGEVALRSVRQIHWDLQMSEFNCVDPLPRQIRAMLEPR
jgi:hypothetical protein